MRKSCACLYKSQISPLRVVCVTEKREEVIHLPQLQRHPTACFQLCTPPPTTLPLKSTTTQLHSPPLSSSLLPVFVYVTRLNQYSLLCRSNRPVSDRTSIYIYIDNHATLQWCMIIDH